MVRYFFRFGYIGTKYSGSQKQVDNPVTIQGTIENALSSLPCSDASSTYFASRTDKGVHALTNTLHVDLNHKTPNEIYQPHYIKSSLNQYFTENEHDIRINHASIVPEKFHARFQAKWRSYFYRLAILKPGVNHLSLKRCQEHIPISEINRCFAVPSELNTSLVKHVADMYCGQHDFSAFTKYLLREPWRRAVRVIDECRFYQAPNSSFMNDPQYENVSIWEFHIQSKAFMYHQVRKLVGTAVAAGLGVINLSDVESVLVDPNPNITGKFLLPPACGLYLANIHYDREVFIMDEDTEIPKKLLLQSN